MFRWLSNWDACVSRYWGIAGGPVLSVWLALDDSLKENGALQVIPGTAASHSGFPAGFRLLSCLDWTDIKAVKLRFFLPCLSRPIGSHHAGMLPHRQAVRPGNMLSVNQEIPEELVQVDEAVLCPLLAGQMSVSVSSLLNPGEQSVMQRD